MNIFSVTIGNVRLIFWKSWNDGRVSTALPQQSFATHSPAGDQHLEVPGSSV
jgi:hypothetical protein